VVVVEYFNPITGLQIGAIGGASTGSKKGGKPESVTFYKGRCGGSANESNAKKGFQLPHLN